MPIPIKSANFSRMEERIRKLEAEIETARRIHEQKRDPIEVLDDLLHTMFQLAREGLSKHFPDYSEMQINELLRRLAMFYQNHRRKRTNN
jgi:hypothetical protein